MYLVGLHGAGYDLVGSAYLAFPFFLTGHNGTISWGVTAALTDTVDIYEEQLNPVDPDLYRHNGEWKRFNRLLKKPRRPGLGMIHSGS